MSIGSLKRHVLRSTQMMCDHIELCEVGFHYGELGPPRGS